MADPLTEVVGLLQPGAPFTKVVDAAGRWRVRRSEYGRPFYCLCAYGSATLAVDGQEPIVLQQGDFALIPAADSFTMTSLEAALEEQAPVRMADGEYRLGDQRGPAEVRLLIGYCEFRSSDAALLVSLIPHLVHVRGEKRLATLAQLVSEEARAQRPARDVVLARLLEVLLIEALRAFETSASPGLVRGLHDEFLSVALRRLHEDPARQWTVAELAKEAALSRSAFFDRFNRVVGVTPMDYLLAWRMALAKKLLRQKHAAVATVAEGVGYSSASTFSVAFTRYVGIPPMRFARDSRQA